MHDTTLQLNLSPGDIKYAHITVPALVNSHRYSVREVLAVVDCCRPQKTKLVDPDKRFPELVFAQKVEKISAIVEDLKNKGYIDRVVYLTPGHPLQRTISEKYLNGYVNETHDYGGCALMSYLAAFELTTTQYIIHYDADMLIYSEPGYDWAIEAKTLIDNEPKAVAATPRISPPLPENVSVDAPSLHEERPLSSVEGGWRNDWFSTRCFLMDINKLSNYLPLMQGRLLLETALVKLLNRGYPRSPEIMLFKRIGFSGGWRLNLSSRKSWLLHPKEKPERFLNLLPQIQSSIGYGLVPKAQKGYADIDLAAWEEYFSKLIP